MPGEGERAEGGVSGPVPGRSRIAAIDVLRGVAMVLMVLDHSRDFYFGPTRVSPTNLAETTPLLFFTRWFTHFCAPVFVFLAGTSARIHQARRGVPATSSFLLTRGLVLVLLEITVVRMCWIPDPFYRFTLIQVIWAIGWAMVLLSFAIRLPGPATLVLGAAIVLLHNTVDAVNATDFGSFSFVWQFLFERGRWEPLAGHRVFITYPVVPWFGVILLGHAFGAVMLRDPATRRTATLRLGLAATALFVVARAVNLYGDPHPWAAQRTATFTLLSFLNCEKYPPSLLYVLMTLGPALIALSLLDREEVARTVGARALAVLGGVPLFFYVAHLALLRYTSAPLAFRKFGASAFQPPPGHAGSPEYDLWAVYLVWVLAVALLYLPSRWFLRKKEANPTGVLKYF